MTITRIDMDDDMQQAALAQVQRDWNAAAERWHADRLAEVYTQDALFFGGRPGHSVGRSAVQDYFATYVGVIESGAMVLAEQHLAQLGPDCLLAQGYVDFSFTLQGGQQTRSRLRATLVLVREGAAWRIRQHHFSPTPEAPPLGQS
ncbi:SgcJ/EcaC family oxidoreductase [Variovorax sp. KK3]|uniref:YybH family protein n=1 Tax=Variovorax sp. KK3 TaxID=1855728 RepID=UPI0021178A0F|nr:SgcJ/EcaC family oxidoreductase [Variovorax sp. KK3]